MTTHQQGHRLRVYPLPPLPSAQLVMISMQERKVLGLMQRPLQLEQPLFPVSVLHNRPALKWLQAPVSELEPLFDIEKRVRAAEALIQPEDRFRLKLRTPQGVLKARLEFVQTLQPDVQHLPPGIQQALQSSAPHWIGQWAVGDNRIWYFSCRFESSQADHSEQKRAELAFGLQYSAGHSQLWRFEKQANGPWLAHSLSEPVPSWQPDALLQQLIEHQPLAFAEAPQFASDPTPKAMQPRTQVPLYQDPEWQAFENASQVLSDIFELMQTLSHEQRTTQEHATPDLAGRIQALLRKPQLSKSLRRQLALRFEEYRAQTQQAFQHADQAHYIFVFWQTFFQVFFDSLPVPRSLQQLTPYSAVCTVRQGKHTRLLQYFSSRSDAGEILIWALAFDPKQAEWSLLDLRPAHEDDLPAARPAFSFVQAYHQLSPEVQALILPHWPQFLPLRNLPPAQEE
ncbi:MAG: hypothetical protein IGS03_03990 [Candidatus Sericytochromatia bacterium]|nr:hypothetical protein [Candidatus Sericytochromatia bacterium]